MILCWLDLTGRQARAGIGERTATVGAAPAYRRIAILLPAIDGDVDGAVAVVLDLKCGFN